VKVRQDAGMALHRFITEDEGSVGTWFTSFTQLDIQKTILLILPPSAAIRRVIAS
jgi:hypothetical protein